MGRIHRKEIDREIINTIEKDRIIDRKKLIEIVFSRLKSSKKSESAGRSTIIRYLDELKRENLITILNKKDYKRFGVKKKDSRVVFYTLPHIIKEYEHYDEVIGVLNNGSESEKEMALIEIESLKTIILSPQNLSNLLFILNKNKSNLSDKIIRILDYNFNNFIFPSDISNFQKTLIKFLEKNWDNIHKNIEAHIIWMLGVLGNEKVIDFLKKRIKEDFSDEELRDRGYSFWSVSNMIIQNQTELFRCGKDLSKEQKLVLFRIRYKAKENLDDYHKNILNYRNALGDSND